MSHRQPTPSSASSTTPVHASSQPTSFSSINSFSSFLSYCSYRRSFLLHLVAFLLLLRLAIYVDFTAVYLCLAALYAIFVNVSHSSPAGTQPRISAYSAFNTGGARMAGSISLDSWEGAYRPPGSAASTDASGTQRAAGALSGVKPHPKRTSKAANQPCVCGSGKKYKNCCSLARDSERSDVGKAEWLEE